MNARGARGECGGPNLAAPKDPLWNSAKWASVGGIGRVGNNILLFDTIAPGRPNRTFLAMVS